MEHVTQNTNPSIPRDYDQDPIKIINYSVLFESYLILIIAIFALPLLIIDLEHLVIAGDSLTLRLSAITIVWIYLLYIIFFDYPKKFKLKKSHFLFMQNSLHYHYIYLQKIENDLNLIVDIENISQVANCIVCELPQSYGRWHHLTPWQLYRKSSIGVHIGKATLFLRYIITYTLFILPYKLWRLYRSGEPFSLLRKNFFIQLDNRNYFLVNIYSQKELDELIEYFKVHNIQIVNKTYFIPHLQNQGWFVDKEEVWTNEFKNQGEK